MARLMSQIKGGYYAADPAAVAAVLERLRRPSSGECFILDPCAGEGHALLQLAHGLNAIAFGIELSEDRAAILRQAMSEDQALAPADFLRCAISYRSFSVFAVNPPYDYATGGEGRVETQFIERAAHLLADNGVLALVCPHDVADSYQTSEFFEQHFQQVSAMPFPEEVRKYNETVILGCKRKQPRVVSHRDCPYDWLEQRMAGPRRLHVACRRASQDVPRDGTHGHRIGKTGLQEPAQVPYRTPCRSSRLSSQAAFEPWQRAPGHASGIRPHRWAHLPAQRAAPRHSRHGRQGRVSSRRPTQAKTSRATSRPRLCSPSGRDC